MKDEPLVVCPKKLCRQEIWGEGKVKRLIGRGAGLIFKGSGFYSTDYRSPSYQESAKKESGPSKGEDAKPGADKAKESGSSKSDGVKSGSGSEKAAGSSDSTPAAGS